MKHFVAVYLGSADAMARWQSIDEQKRKEQEQAGMRAWIQWAADHANAIVDPGTPLGKTKRVNAQGMDDTRNQIAAYSVVRADSHEEAARIFLNHPHFMMFPGDSIEVMECLPIPRL